MCALPALGAVVPVRATALDVKNGFAAKVDDDIVFRDLDAETRWYAMHRAEAAQEVAVPPISVGDLITAPRPVTNGQADVSDPKPPKRRKYRRTRKAKAAHEEPAG
jgi:hypothetical protein